MGSKDNPCVTCYYARMRRDICGIYCTGGFEKEDGKCDHYDNWREHERVKRKSKNKHRALEGV